MAMAPKRGGRIFNLRIIDRQETICNRGIGLVHFDSMGADLTIAKHIILTPTLPPTLLLPSGYPATLQPSRTALWGLIICQGIFLAPSIFRFKHFMEASCSSAINYKSIILAQFHRIKLWGLNFIYIYQDNYSTNTTQSLPTFAKQHYFYLGSSLLSTL
jgi:hypothetical protein